MALYFILTFALSLVPTQPWGLALQVPVCTYICVCLPLAYIDWKRIFTLDTRFSDCVLGCAALQYAGLTCVHAMLPMLLRQVVELSGKASLLGGPCIHMTHCLRTESSTTVHNFPPRIIWSSRCWKEYVHAYVQNDCEKKCWDQSKRMLSVPPPSYLRVTKVWLIVKEMISTCWSGTRHQRWRSTTHTLHTDGKCVIEYMR